MYLYKKNNAENKVNTNSSIPVDAEEIKQRRKQGQKPLPEKSTADVRFGYGSGNGQHKTVFASQYVPLPEDVAGYFKRLIGFKSAQLNDAKLHYVFNGNDIVKGNSEITQQVLNQFNLFPTTFKTTMNELSSDQIIVNDYIETVLVDSLKETNINHLINATITFMHKNDASEQILHYACDQENPSIVVGVPSKEGNSWELLKLGKKTWDTAPGYYTGSCKLPAKSIVITASNNVWRALGQNGPQRALSQVEQAFKDCKGAIDQEAMNQAANYIKYLANIQDEDVSVSVVYV